MGEIKSAWEKAMERVDKLGDLTEDERKRIEYVPIGDSLAGRFLKDETVKLADELSKYKGDDRKYVLQGLQETLLRNINLPKDDRVKATNTKAFAAFTSFKQNQKQLKAAFDLINHLFEYYENARQQTYNQFKQNFEAKFQESMHQQQAAGSGRGQAEMQAQFQEEWRKLSGQLDSQYDKVLTDHKQQLAKVV
jgi:hypothetical protein